MDNNLISNGQNWDFRRENTTNFTHCYHSYPARMIPQIARRLIKEYGIDSDSKLIFDPFCGSGTVLVEGILSGFDVIGTDLNPLARLITESKCTTVNEAKLKKHISNYLDFIESGKHSEQDSDIPKFKNINFWFYENTIVKLSRLKKFIMEIPSEEIRLFFIIAFSETVRESSISKPSEFKLVRKKDRVKNGFDPDVNDLMLKKLYRNFDGLTEYSFRYQLLKKKPKVKIESFDTSKVIPEQLLDSGSVDIVITSPPYGDSSTTVAYGQFSRLSNQWLGIEDNEAFRVDKHLMGGVQSREIQNFDIEQLDSTISNIDKLNHKRALTVSSFYSDLLSSCNNVSRAVKYLGYVCYVVSNRRVQGMTLPTDIAVTDFFKRNGFYHVTTFTRNIPNKRMPFKNSPTNEIGKTDTTMTQESIIILQKRFTTIKVTH